MHKVLYRNALIEDLAEIVSIYNSTVPSGMVTADTEMISVESRQCWFYEHNAKRPLWIAENEQSEILGWISFQSFYGRPAYDATVEISIYLKEDFRGKGLGKNILADSLAKARTFGVKTVIGYIFAHNAPSIHLFSNLGFDVWGTLPNIAELFGVERSVIIMGRRIN